MYLPGIVAGCLAAAVAPVVVRWLRCSDRPARIEGEWKVVEYGPGYRVLMIVHCAFFLTLAVLAARFPGSTDPAELPWIIAGFVLFSLLGLGGYGLLNRATLYWNGQEVRGPGSWVRRIRASWRDIVSAQYVEWAGALRLTTAAGAAVWVNASMTGFDEFCREVQSRGLFEN